MTIEEAEKLGCPISIIEKCKWAKISSYNISKIDDTNWDKVEKLINCSIATMNKPYEPILTRFEILDL